MQNRKKVSLDFFIYLVGFLGGQFFYFVIFLRIKNKKKNFFFNFRFFIKKTMLSNHHQSSSSFRIIEPKRFQQAQQIPVSMSNQQIPILSMRSNQTYDNNSYPVYQQQAPRVRNLSDTDSSYIPGKANKKENNRKINT